MISIQHQDFSIQEEELLGSDAIVTNTDEAIRTAMVYMNPSICSTCTSRVFSECAMQPDNSRSTNINPDTNKPPITPL